MRYTIILAGFLATCALAPALAQPPEFGFPGANHIDECKIPENGDSWRVEPSKENPGEYVFTYVNSKYQCSDTHKGTIVEAEDGFKVKMYVEVGANDNKDELIYIVPEDTQYTPFPAEVYLPDESEKAIIRLIPGMV